nr:immunoglobulin heavy chain junction region [Mus musculus]
HITVLVYSTGTS